MAALMTLVCDFFLADEDGAKRVLTDAEREELAEAAQLKAHDDALRRADNAAAVADSMNPTGWDTVVNVHVQSLGVSIINGIPAEIAYFSCQGVAVNYGLTTWERFLQILVDHVQLDDTTDVAAFPEILVPLPLEENQQRLFTFSVVQTLV